MLFVIIASLIAYLITGMTMERNRYALARVKCDSIEMNRDYYDRLYDEAKAKRDSIPHKSYCFTYISGNHSCQNCTTTNSDNWRKYTLEMKEAKAGRSRAPVAAVSPTAVFFWPGVLGVNWIKSGEPKNSPEAQRLREIAEAKHDAEIAELRARESRALDKELANYRKLDTA